MKIKKHFYLLSFFIPTFSYTQNFTAIIQFTDSKVIIETPVPETPTGNIF